MIPKFNGDASGNGEGILYETLSCVVYEALNGDYYLEFTYPADGESIKYLRNGGSVTVVCPSWTVSGGQFFNQFSAEEFDIYSSELTIDGVIKFTANHRSRKLARRVYADFDIYGDISVMLPKVLPATTVARYGDYNAAWSFTAEDTPKSLLSCMIGSENSMASKWGYEFAFSSYRDSADFRVWQFTHRGEDRGAKIRYGVNLTDINYAVDKLGAYNAILAWATDSDGNKVMYTNPGGDPMLSYPTNPPAEPVEAVAMDFSEQIQNPTPQDLNGSARVYLNTNKPWLPAETITADFINNAEIDDHSPEVWLGDTVAVLWPSAGVTESMRVIGYEYDVLDEKYIRMELGTKQTEFVATTGDMGGSSAPSGGGSGADYIIEQGTSGIWTWRKWASGLAECVCKAAYALTLSTQWGSSGIYYNTGGAVSETLPNGLFTSADECFYNISAVNASGGDSWPCIASGTPLSTSNTCGIYLLRIGQQNTQKTFSISWRVVGRWN